MHVADGGQEFSLQSTMSSSQFLPTKKISFSIHKHNERSLLSRNVAHQLHTLRLELPNYLSYVSNTFHPICKHKRLTYVNLWYLYKLIYTELLANGPNELKHVGDITKMAG
jgi:hypothetical protein